MNTENYNRTAYFLLRIAMGINMLGHGAARIPKLQAFSDGVVAEMSKGWLPEILVKPWAMALPFIELILGILLIIGLFTYRTLIAGAVLIIILLFGSSTIENWGAMGTQMIYAFLFYLLMINMHNNSFSMDKRINKIFNH